MIEYYGESLMLINGSIRTNKTDILIEKYVELVNKGINPSKILVLTLNPFKKQHFTEQIKNKINLIAVEKFNIYTFYGLCYNAFLDNWTVLENIISEEKPVIIPNLCGLETSQFIFKQSIALSGFKDYSSKVNLMHQLFRRYSLIVQNNLSDGDVENRSDILKEAFDEDCRKAVNNFKHLTLKYRSFDYQRQLSIFPYLYQNTSYFKDIEYLFIDDADEISYAQWCFVNHLKPQLKDIFAAYDTKGSSRCGFLSAFKNGADQFIKNKTSEIIYLKSDDEPSLEADNLYSCITEGRKLESSFFVFSDYVKRLDMIDAALQKIKDMKESGINPQNMTIITPLIDDILKFAVKESFEKNNIKYQIISGSEKLSDNILIKNILSIIKLANNNHAKISPLELRGIIYNVLQIPIKYCLEIITSFKNENLLIDYDFKNEEYNKKYSLFKSVINELSQNKMSHYNQALLIYKRLLSRQISNKDIKKYSFLLKEIEGFEKAFPLCSEQDKFSFLIQLENSIISENPSTAEQIEENSVIIATPQKIIDFEIKSDYQIWLDISNSEWQKQDTGTLYNSWVFNADWNKNEFTFEDNLELSRDKTARILRKLVLCTNKKIIAVSSLYDSLGNENFGGINEYFTLNNEDSEISKPEFKIIPRQDQKPVLEYTKGKTGIMAVPGAGKTTILLALIIKLLQNKIKPENIFVLTYMESAARNLKERIKTYYPQVNELPNISTIHGLALRIIKENANYIQLGYNHNFEICDDNRRQKIIRETLLKLNIEQENYENYERGISALKLSPEKPLLHSKYKDLNRFINFYKIYNKNLLENNLIDYDDMLCLAVKLLEENPSICDYYQEICHIIIEDEAQDSSALQQKLLSVLSGRHKNLIRCGDINQSINTTFTNSDLKDFTDFLFKNNKIEMTSSQRCAKPIYTFANKFIKYISSFENLKNAFYQIEMQPTEKNPASINEVITETFDEEAQEKNYILKTVKNILHLHPEASIAILLRNNYQSAEYDFYFRNNGLKTLTRSDCLEQKNVFRVIHSFLKIIDKPWNNKVIIECAKVLQESGIYNIKTKEIDLIKSLNEPFINISPDEIKQSGLLQFYWDINYWINQSYISLDNLAAKIGMYYFSSQIEKSNVYLISVLIKRLMTDYKTSEIVMEKLADISKRPLQSGFKFFQDEDNLDEKEKIHIMTVHKSKGDEFDFVFIPELTEDNYTISEDVIKIKANSNFMEAVKALNPNYKKKDETEMKVMHMEENARLLYVAFTRAKQGLFLTCSKKYKKKSHPHISKIFTEMKAESYVK